MAPRDYYIGADHKKSLRSLSLCWHLPEIFSSARVILVGAADKQDVDGDVDSDDCAGGDQVLLVTSIVLGGGAQASAKRVENDPTEGHSRDSDIGKSPQDCARWTY